MGAICSCNTKSWTNTHLSLCCNNNMTNANYNCENPFTLGDLYTSGGKANVSFITNLPCYSTKWYNTTNGKITGVNITNFKNSLLAKVTITYCVQTCLCITWCVPVYETLGCYISIEPLSNFINQIKLTKYFNKKIKIIPYKFNYKNKYSLLLHEYNLINFKKINYYIEMKDIIIPNFCCSNLQKNINITLKCPFGPTFSSSMNIFTTIVSNMLINDKFTNDTSLYFRRLVVYSRKLLTYAYYYYYITNNLKDIDGVNLFLTNYINNNNLSHVKNKKDLSVYFVKNIFKVQYIENNIISTFFTKYTSIIIFIYLIIMENAKNKSLVIDLKFDICFSKLILSFSKKHIITTHMVNKKFSKICSNILNNNYDNIFNKYIEYFLNQNEERYYIPAKYIPLFYNFNEMSEIDKTIGINDLVNKFVNVTKFEDNLNFYRKNYKVSQYNTNLTNIDILPKDMQNKIINAFTSQNTDRKLYKNYNNTEKKCNCGNNKLILND